MKDLEYLYNVGSNASVFALTFISSLQVIVHTLNLVCRLNIASLSLQTTNSP